MKTPRELTKFKVDEDGLRVFYLHESVMIKSFPDSERAEKIVAWIRGSAVEFYFDRLTPNNAPREEAKDLCYFVNTEAKNSP